MMFSQRLRVLRHDVQAFFAKGKVLRKTADLSNAYPEGLTNCQKEMVELCVTAVIESLQ